MGVLKGIAYLVGAILILAVLATGIAVVFVLGVIGTLICSLVPTVLFTAAGIRSYFEEGKSSKRGDLKKRTTIVK